MWELWRLQLHCLYQGYTKQCTWYHQHTKLKITNIIEIIYRTVSVGGLDAECLGTHGQIQVLSFVITPTLSLIKWVSIEGHGEFSLNCLLIYYLMMIQGSLTWTTSSCSQDVCLRVNTQNSHSRTLRLGLLIILLHSHWNSRNPLSSWRKKSSSILSLL